jgi:tRNA 2-thiouridine synthesizing protein A
LSETSEIVVDARGHRCPTPTLRLRRALERAPAGALVRLLADDPLARIDVPHFATEGGFELVGFGEAEGVLTFTIRKPSGVEKQ